MKNLGENKDTTKILKTISNSSNGNGSWQMYGTETLINALCKDLAQTFPFIYQEKHPEMFLKVSLDMGTWNYIFQQVGDHKEAVSFKFLLDIIG